MDIIINNHDNENKNNEINIECDKKKIIKLKKRGRRIGQTYIVKKYKLLIYNFLTKEFVFIDDFSTVYEIAKYLDLTYANVWGVLQERSSFLCKFLKIEMIDNKIPNLVN